MTPQLPPKRLRAADVIDNQQALLEAALTHTQPSTARPSFKIAQVKAVGGSLVTEWDVYVPVCDEYPSADEAFNAARVFAAELAKAYPPNGTGDDLEAKLRASVKK